MKKKNVWAECGVVKYKYYFNLAKPFIHEIGLLLQISIHKVSDFKQNRCECKTRIVLYDWKQSKEKYNKIKQKLVGVGVESSINQRGTIQNTHKQNEKISLARIVKMIW